MFPANILPGQGFLSFEIYEKDSNISPTGRPVSKGYAPNGATFHGILVNASQKEIDQWKQNGHPITHKIIEYSAEQKAKPTDYLKRETGEEYYIQGTKNPGNLDVTMIYYVEERFDILETGGE